MIRKRGNARVVMLCENIDIADGLINGVCGPVTHIVYPKTGDFPQKVFVKFDDDRVGTQRMKQTQRGYQI